MASNLVKKLTSISIVEEYDLRFGHANLMYMLCHFASMLGFKIGGVADQHYSIHFFDRTRH